MASMSSSLLFFSTFLLISSISSEAKDFLVGGSTDSWKIPTSTSDSLNKWAEANRFQVGDSLVWRYEAAKDSVLQVTREDYLSCNTSNPIAAHKDGTTVVSFHRSGAYYFVSGAEGACQKGQKMIVVVMSERHALRGISPAPAPVDYEGPAIAPTSGSNGVAVVKRGVLGALVVLGMMGFAF
ncbi:early nodulin-like protein 14 [Typha latifolia]|uniref:early nodulin-like protein 14 n=1 Tax=Typha latifolia TaxID=4733 RepID=UPI003C2D6EAC